METINLKYLKKYFVIYADETNNSKNHKDNNLTKNCVWKYSAVNNSWFFKY